jgi:hypothetical protein
VPAPSVVAAGVSCYVVMSVLPSPARRRPSINSVARSEGYVRLGQAFPSKAEKQRLSMHQQPLLQQQPSGDDVATIAGLAIHEDIDMDDGALAGEKRGQGDGDSSGSIAGEQSGLAIDTRNNLLSAANANTGDEKSSPVGKAGHITTIYAQEPHFFGRGSSLSDCCSCCNCCQRWGCVPAAAASSEEETLLSVYLRRIPWLASLLVRCFCEMAFGRALSVSPSSSRLW